jgi:hypothetical protein
VKVAFKFLKYLASTYLYEKNALTLPSLIKIMGEEEPGRGNHKTPPP